MDSARPRCARQLARGAIDQSAAQTVTLLSIPLSGARKESPKPTSHFRIEEYGRPTWTSQRKSGRDHHEALANPLYGRPTWTSRRKRCMDSAMIKRTSHFWSGGTRNSQPPRPLSDPQTLPLCPEGPGSARSAPSPPRPGGRCRPRRAGTAGGPLEGPGTICPGPGARKLARPAPSICLFP